MTPKTTKIIYWLGVALTSLWFGTSGNCELTTNPLVWGITLKLGFPATIDAIIAFTMVAFTYTQFRKRYPASHSPGTN